jgi:hypothetical protein
MTAAALLEDFRKNGIVVEVTHRAKRRLYGLPGLVPLRDGTMEPRRPMPGRGRGQPPLEPDDTDDAPPPVPPAVPLTPIQHRSFDYSDLDAAMAAAEQTIRDTRASLRSIAAGEPVGVSEEAAAPASAVPMEG